MKPKYTVLGSGVLTLTFIAWLLTASMPAGVVIMLLTLEGYSNIYVSLGLLGVSELLLILPLVVYMLVTKTNIRSLMGNRSNWKQWLAASLVGVFMMPALQGLNVAVSELFTLLGAKMPDTSSMEPVSVGSLLMGMAMIGVTAGIVEEPIFRGVVLRGIGSAVGRRWAVVLTALAFAFVHMEIVGLPSRFIIGIVLGFMAWRSGAVLPGVLAHAAYNSSALAVSLLFSTVLRDWNGFAVIQSAPDSVNTIITWCLISLPFIALAFAAYRVFARVTPKSAAWNDRPYARAAVKPLHSLPWIGIGIVSLVLTALTTAQMWMSQLQDMLSQIAGQLR